jgi:N-acetylneuraminate synthase
VSRTIEIIAEAGVNHNGSLERALALVDAAAEAGAHTIKFQTFQTEELVTKAAPMADYQKKNTGKEQSQFDLLKALELSQSDFVAIKAYCSSRSINFLSTPFDAPSLRFLIEDLGVSRLKLGSGELTNGPLLYDSAKSKLPVILSTGMGNLSEIREALAVLYAGYRDINLIECRRLPDLDDEALSFLAQKVTLLHCTSTYPANPESLNLQAIQTLEKQFRLPVGYSDHSLGIHIPIAAVSFGARVIEKHFTFDKDLPGPDHKASLEPAELQAMVRQITEVEAAFGDGVKAPCSDELDTAKVARKSLLAAHYLSAGQHLKPEDLRVKRPGTGISPMRFWSLIGHKLTRSYQPEDLLDE